MEFNDKLKELRKSRGFTQQELADKLFVSRTAVSKWESGRGYPNIESLKQIAEVFSVSVDELISTNEAIELAEDNEKRGKKHFCDLIFGISDIFALLLIFMPLFAESSGEIIKSVPLISLTDASLYLKIAYFAAVLAIVAIGAATLALQNAQAPIWLKSKRIISLAFGSAAVLIFTATLNPYAAVLAFALLAVKIFALIKQ